jgi:hypothetical protein
MLIDVMPLLIEGKTGLQILASNEDLKSIFPDTVGRAKELLNVVGALIPDPREHHAENRSISKDELQFLEMETHVLVSTLISECEKANVIALEKQRAFDLHTLIESIETAFDSKMWNRLSAFSKKDIEESGRCLAFERYTASGFHMLRAMENETRDCAMLVTRAIPLKRDFGEYVRLLTANGVDPKLIAVLDNVRSLERNPLVHPEAWLSQDDAINIFCISQAVFSRLTSCMERLNLFPPK